MITNTHTETVASMQSQAEFASASDEPYVTISSIFSRVQSKPTIANMDDDEDGLEAADSRSPSLPSISELKDELMRRSKALSYADEHSNISAATLSSHHEQSGEKGVSSPFCVCFSNVWFAFAFYDLMHHVESKRCFWEQGSRNLGQSGHKNEMESRENGMS